MKSAKCLKLPEHLQSSNDRATARRSSVKQCSFFSDRTGKLRFSENYKVAIIAPRDEHCSRNCQIPKNIFSNEGFKRRICSEAEATIESCPTHAHHAER